MRLKRVLFSGYSEASPGGFGYKSAQVTANYILDPAERVLVYVDESPIGKSDSMKRKTSRFLGAIKPWKKYLRNKSDRKETNKKKKKS